METKKTPPKTGKFGRLRYKIWRNTKDDGRIRTDVDIFRSYKTEPKGEKDTGWRESHTFSVDDLKLFPALLDEIERELLS